jgi:hypothetical protein
LIAYIKKKETRKMFGSTAYFGNTSFNESSQDSPVSVFSSFTNTAASALNGVGADLFQNKDEQRNHEKMLKEEQEGNKIRIAEREKRMQETELAEEARRKGFLEKQKSFKEALEKAKMEQIKKEEQRANSLLMKTNIISRMDQKQTEYQMMRKVKALEMSLMATEDVYMKKLMSLEKEEREKQRKRDEAKRKATQKSIEFESYCMSDEDDYCRMVFGELDRIEAARLKKEQDEAAKVKALKWNILSEVAKPHGIHRDPSFINLSSLALGDVDTIVLKDIATLREVCVLYDV